MRIGVKKSALENFWKARFDFEKSDPEDYETWKGVSTKIKILDGRVEGHGNYLELPVPLEAIGFRITAQQKRINYGYEIYFRDPKILKGLSVDYQEVMARTKNIFCPTTNDLTGYLLDSDNNCNADIIALKGDNDNESRSISFGLYASRVREYEKINDLVNDITELSALAGSIVQCSIDKYNRLHPRKKIVLPHFEIQTNLTITPPYD